MPGKLLIDADSRGAVKAVKALTGSFSEANQALELMKKGFSGVASAVTGLTGLIKEQGDFFSQVGALGKDGMQQLTVMRTATDDMIKSTELLRSLNVLTRNNVEMSVESMELLGTASVQLARQTGQSGESIMRMLTDALSSGRVSSLNKFGLQMETTGTLAEKQARILDTLSAKYKGISVTATDANEVFAKSNNALQVSLMETAQKYEKWYVKFNGFVAQGIQGLAALGGGQTRAQRDEERYLSTMESFNDALSERRNIVKVMIRTGGSNLEVQQKLLATYKKEAVALKAEIAAAKERGDSFDREIGLLDIVNKQYAKRLQIVRKLRKEETNWLAVKAAADKKIAENIKALGMIVDKHNAKLKKDRETRIKSSRSWAKAEEGRKRAYREQLALLELREEIYEEEDKRAPAQIARDKSRLESILGMSRVERERFLRYEKAEEANKAHTEATTQALKEKTAQWTAQYEQAIQAEEEYENKRKAWQQERFNSLQQEALAKKKLQEQAKFQYVGAAGEFSGQIRAAELDLQRQKAAEDEAGISRAEKRINLLKTEANRLGALKTNYAGFFTAANEAKGMIQSVSKSALEAAFMETSKLKELGKSRVQFVKEATAALLKTKAIEWGAKAVGSAAEGTIALVTPGAQGLAGGFFKAAAMYTAAAAAAGLASKGLSKGASKGGAGAGATTQAPTAMGTESTGTSIVINISESVMGDPDAVAGKIQSMIADGQNRGTVNSWQG